MKSILSFRDSRFVKYILFQIVFWIIAYLFLVSIVMLLITSLANSYELTLHIHVLANMGSAILFGTFQGIAFGITEQMLENAFFKKQSLGMIILSKGVLYFFTTFLLLSIFRIFIYDHIMNALFESNQFHRYDKSWKFIFYLVMLYIFLMSLIISFITQVSKKFGPSLMAPLLLGKYRVPREEYRVFLFMDLKSSTTIAETIGHIPYSAFIRDCFSDINLIVSKSRAEIYQYIGDEVVITWLAKDVTTDFTCLKFFFDCEVQFRKRTLYYQQQYGITPQFKAGAHIGKVTAVEIGEIKRDVAFHGDTLNTAARLQSLCNEYNQWFLISATLADHVGHSPYFMHSLGTIQLRGKTIPVEIISVEQPPAYENAS